MFDTKRKNSDFPGTTPTLGSILQAVSSLVFWLVMVVIVIYSAKSVFDSFSSPTTYTCSVPNPYISYDHVYGWTKTVAVTITAYPEIYSETSLELVEWSTDSAIQFEWQAEYGNHIVVRPRGETEPGYQDDGVMYVLIIEDGDCHSKARYNSPLGSPTTGTGRVGSGGV